MYSTASDCEALAHGRLGGSGDRWDHVQLVAKTTDELCADLPSRVQLVSAAWLHDVGYAPELVVTGMHALDGAVFLDRRGAPSELVSLVAYHTGAEFEAEERGLSQRLNLFERPPQEDLDVMILVDLISGPAGERVTVDERLADILRRYESQHPVHRAVSRSWPYLIGCAGRGAARVGYPM